MPAARFHLTAPTAPESDIQAAVLAWLALDRRVAWAGRFNSGAARFPATPNSRPQFVRFHTVPGFPDVAGQLTDGLGLYLECKRPGERLTPAQLAFLARALWGRAAAGVVRSVEDARAILDGDWSARMARFGREAVVGQGRAPDWPPSLRLPSGFREWFATQTTMT